MKKILPLLVLISTINLYAQKDVELNINHQLSSDPFSFNSTTKTNTGADFDVNRLEYYIAEIVLEHDGGTMTSVADFWILADAGDNSPHQLGTFNIANLEAIHFAIGVQESYNHKDPATYPASHPLAPKSPSMHWGWGPGYRFLAIEGKKGNGMSETYELHCVGDDYYFTQRIPTAGAEVSGKLVITLNADYTKILENIQMTGVVVDHGELPNNIKALENMFNFVFTSSEGNGNTNSTTTGIEGSKQTIAAKVYPNPSTGRFFIEMKENSESIYQFQLFDLSGRLIEEYKMGNNAGNYSIKIEHKGMFQGRIIDGNRAVTNLRIVLTN